MCVLLFTELVGDPREPGDQENDTAYDIEGRILTVQDSVELLKGLALRTVEGDAVIAESVSKERVIIVNLFQYNLDCTYLPIVYTVEETVSVTLFTYSLE